MNNYTSKKTVRTFSFASFLNDLGSDMISPIWPLFLTEVLGANMTVLGLIDGIGEALVSISQAISGYISDRIKKRKLFIWIGYLLASLSRIGYALSHWWPMVIPFRILDRAGKMRGAPRDAIIADVSGENNRGKHFGILRAMDNLGAVCGIAICIFFFKDLGFRKLMAIAAIPSALGSVLIFTKIKERKMKDVKLYQSFQFSKLNNNFRLLLFLSALFSLGSFTYSFLILFAKANGFHIASLPLLYLVFNVIASAVSIPFGKMSDRIGRKKVLALSYILWALLCASYIFFQNSFIIITSFILYGIHKGALDPVEKSLVSELSPQRFRASYLGTYQMIVGLCALPASLIAGILWDRIGITMPFIYSLGTTIIAMMMLMFVREKKEC